jgi:hypothetical protein
MQDSPNSSSSEESELSSHIKRECYYYVQHLSRHLKLCQVIKLSGNESKFGDNESGLRRRITKFSYNLQRSKKHSANLQRVTSIDAPVLAAVHRRLLKHNPDLVGAMSSSESDSLVSASSSSSDGATRRRAASSRRSTSNRGRTLKKSSDDIDFLAAKFATTKLSPSRTLSAPVTGDKKGHKVKGAV